MKKLILLCCLAHSLHSTVLQVPGTYATMQDAINASTNGDTIEVQPGTYYENINFRGKRILMTSLFYLARDTAYIRSTVINGSTPLNPDTASCVIFNSGEDSTAILQGFTLTGGNGTKWTDPHGAGIYREGGGILIAFSSPTICYNIIENNKAVSTTGVASAGGGGLRIGDGNPILHNNIIINNQGKYGPGIVLNYTGCTMRNNLIANNSGATSYGGGGGIWINNNEASGHTRIIENNTIVNNASYAGSGSGIYAGSAVNNIVRNNIIWNNTPLTSQVKTLSATIQAAYNDVQNGYAGTGNINVNPALDACYGLSTSSPCIDAGDTAVLFNDITSTPSVALFPSMGTQRNDIGMTGGPFAFSMNCAAALTGISTINQNEYISIFPNPSNGIFKIKGIETVEGRMVLLDINGSVLSDKIIKGDYVSQIKLGPGIYFLSLTINGNTTIKKVIVTTE